MITAWGAWKRYPRVECGDKLEAPIGPGIYEVRVVATGAVFAFGAVDNLAEALSRVANPPRLLKLFVIRRNASVLPNLEYRICTTDTKKAAKIAADRMIGRREAFLSSTN